MNNQLKYGTWFWMYFYETDYQKLKDILVKELGYMINNMSDEEYKRLLEDLYSRDPYNQLLDLKDIITNVRTYLLNIKDRLNHISLYLFSFLV